MYNEIVVELTWQFSLFSTKRARHLYFVTNSSQVFEEKNEIDFYSFSQCCGFGTK